MKTFEYQTRFDVHEVQNQGQIFVTRDLGYGEVPHGDHCSDHGDAGKVQLNVNGRFQSQTDTKYERKLIEHNTISH